ncbi:MAG: adenylate/guanylate cyclase domain-containing protein [Ignavibacteriales bacterium]|nr:adenylate/guanylate cyclase domain-containing protein [Ignavibacteriales bacterium]
MKSGAGKKKDFFKKILVVLSAALFTIILTQDYIFTFAPLKELELKLIDTRFSKRGPIEIKDSSKVIIIEITQETYNQIPPPNNKAPLPRSVYAKAIENLTKAGAKAIGIDLIMSDADKYSVMNDTMLMQAIKKSGKVVVAGKIDEVIEKQIEDSTYSISSYTNSNYNKIQYNYESIFYDADSSLGIVQMPPDFDAVYRRYMPFRWTAITKKKVPSFGFALINKYLGLKGTDTAKNDNNFFILGNKKILKFDRTSVLINIYGPSRTFQHLNLIDIIDDMEFKTKDETESRIDINQWEVLNEETSYRNLFRGKVFIIGTTMPEDKDVLASAFAKGERKGDNQINGVEFHANIVQNILSNNFLSTQSKESEILLIFFLTALSFYVSYFVRKIKLKIGFIIESLNVLMILLIVFVIYELSIILFIQNKLVIAIVSPSLAVIIGYFSSTAYHFLLERQQNVIIKGMFSQYVSKEVVDQLIIDPGKLRLGGERKNLSVLFSDIAGFTTFAEKKQPEELVSFINEFLNAMTEIILSHNGTLDKYLGDAVMAFWGAPVEVKDHAYKACVTALQMQEKLVEMREKWSSLGETPIRIRIGINTGDVIVGNIGGEKRFDYTVLGDDVNLASRLEGANKEYATNIMISDATYDCCKDKILVRELDVIRVKGKSEPTKVYELISIVGDKKAEEAVEKMDLYFQALELYRQKSFEPALDYFNRSYEKLGDYPSKVYINRCEFYLKNPPDQNWDGVFEMKTK